MADCYQSPLSERYATREMKFIFSPDNKFSTWRKMWVYLAEAEKELGLNISDEQIEEMKSHLYDIDYTKVKEYEASIRHDVMAHLKAYCDVCPTAKPIIHLGATSCYVGDNTDCIITKEALLETKTLLLKVISSLANFAEKYKDLQCLAYTHFQAAQPTTFGKRATLWLQDLMFDLENIDHVLNNLKLLGCKGTTGTCASFLELFKGDEKKAQKLEKIIAKKAGFDGCYDVSGQTYSRKVDYFVLSALSGIAQSCQKFSGDIRLLSHLKEVDEPFEDKQVGSSAMAYKRNPMRSERISALSKFVISEAMNPAMTAGTQWLERTLDDSANRRLSLPEAFLAISGILSLYNNVINGLSVYPKIIEKHLMEELPFMMTEDILMYGVSKGGDRQALHEKIRTLSVSIQKKMKEEGSKNDLLEQIVADPSFNISQTELEALIKDNTLSGLASKQVEQYLVKVCKVLKENEDLLNKKSDLSINV